jgi:ATP-dependent helicase/nuclease subunit B
MSTETGEGKQLVELLDDIVSDEELGELGLGVRSALDYDNHAELDGAIVKELFGREIRSSVTRLGTFAACPYKYFAKYILGLEERKEWKLQPLDVGDFYHRVLDSLVKRLSAEEKDFGAVGQEELLKLLREQTLMVVQTSSFITNFARHSAHNTYVVNACGEALEDCVKAIAQMVRAGEFRPRMSEVSFGQVKDAGETLGEYTIGLSDKRVLYLDGKIDRIDIAGVDGVEIAVVFDYKKKGRSFSWSKFYYGLDMQLPIYMLAVRNASERPYKVAGAFFMPVEVSPDKGTFDKLGKKKESFDYKPSGLFNGECSKLLDTRVEAGWSSFYSFRITSKDEQFGDYRKSNALRIGDFENVFQFAEAKVVELAEWIVSCMIGVSPHKLGSEKACDNCIYKSVCRFDWQVNEYDFLESLGKAEVLERIRAVDG